LFKLLNREYSHEVDPTKNHHNSSISNKFWATFFIGTGTDKKNLWAVCKQNTETALFTAAFSCQLFFAGLVSD
jgi:hypothetical protein